MIAPFDGQEPGLTAVLEVSGHGVERILLLRPGHALPLLMQPGGEVNGVAILSARGGRRVGVQPLLGVLARHLVQAVACVGLALHQRLAQQQRPLLEGDAVGQREAGQERPLVECDRLLQELRRRAGQQLGEGGYVYPAIAGRIPLDGLRGHEQAGGWRCVVACEAAQVEERLAEGVAGLDLAAFRP
jgi:hypothetical protein